MPRQPLLVQLSASWPCIPTMAHCYWRKCSATGGSLVTDKSHPIVSGFISKPFNPCANAIGSMDLLTLLLRFTELVQLGLLCPPFDTNSGGGGGLPTAAKA